ncbi:uncharacterized protein LOC128210457 [Mya arenaria]|uniref:uncharacterized protein LOC128210457 n=1 Tax=Mya arenaria TaxID=6604 RepID=UPI0022E498A0|nr:uncharacterized protein LOC128210457 [Mya arenaria]
MPPEMYDEMLDRIGPRIHKMDTNYWLAIDPGVKLATTLRYLATGDSYTTVSYSFRVSRHTVAAFIPIVTKAIVEDYKDEVNPCPVTAEEWKEIADEFQKRWNVPHALGALDGKHCAIRKPPNSGSLYYNYKKFCSLISASELKESVKQGMLNLPAPAPMPNDDVEFPFFFLVDDAFALRNYMMKPYSRRGLSREEVILNYRISRGRRVVENAYGILASRWRCMLTPMQVIPEVGRLNVEASVILHNIMRMRYPQMQNAEMDKEDEDHNLIPGEWRNGAAMHDLAQNLGHNRDNVEGKNQRDYLKHYFNSPAGSIPWQDRTLQPRDNLRY